MYAELHCHSYYSFLDGVSSPEDLVKRASEVRLSALGLTDHNGFYGFVKFNQAAKEYGLRAIFGAELSLESTKKRSNSINPTGEHLIILTKNIQGYKSLAHAISVAQLNGEKDNPKFSLESLSNVCNNNWFILTGCRKGPLNNALMSKGANAAKVRLEELIELFGKDNIAVELWNHNDPIDIERNDVFAKLAVQHDIRYVATNNVHYSTQKEFYLSNTVAAIRANKTLEDAYRWLPVSGAAYIKGYSEQKTNFARWPGAIETTTDIAAESAFDLNMVAPKLPTFNTNNGMSEIQFLKDVVYKKAVFKYGTRSCQTVKGAYEQLDYELNIIEELGYAGYFLIVYDIVNFCKSNDILCQGRGSAANSTVCYVLEITNVDAVSLKLLFERFLSKAREGPPDIDIDIESHRRDEVINYIYETYSRFNAAQVANVVTYRSRLALRESAKALGYKTDAIEELSSKLKLNGDESFPQPLLSLNNALKTLPRHLSIHTGGMILTKEPVSTICPVEWATRAGRSVLQWDKDDCAEAGLVKFDLLGLRILDAIHEAVSLVKLHHNIAVDISKLPQETDIYTMLSKGDSVGVFQVESRAQMNTLPRLRPKCFYDLVIEVALIRPGPIQGGAVHPYLNRRSKKERVVYDHESARPALEKTLGIPLFQEQLMRLSMDVAGFSAEEADELRSAMSSKRSQLKMEKLQERLLENMKVRGIDRLAAEKIVRQIVAFSGYGFPESHAISFAYLVYISAWFKFHYPEIWLVVLLNAQPMGFWSVSTLIEDAKRHDVKVKGPNVNTSKAQSTVRKDSRYLTAQMGLCTISHLSKELAEKISSSGPYANLEDFVKKTKATKQQIEILASARALDSLIDADSYLKRRLITWNSQILHEITDPARIPGILTPKVPSLLPETEQERLALDTQALGVGLNSHPILLLRESLNNLNIIKAKDLLKFKTGDIIKTAGIVTHRQAPPTARGTVFLNLEDETGFINTVFSPGAWIRWKQEAGNHAIIVKGTIVRVDDTSSVTINVQTVEKLEVVATFGSKDYR